MQQFLVGVGDDELKRRRLGLVPAALLAVLTAFEMRAHVSRRRLFSLVRLPSSRRSAAGRT
ncbi:MAG: hypothetical protein WA484_01270, partial [Solirubrobacteraceae bacterium]